MLTSLILALVTASAPAPTAKADLGGACNVDSDCQAGLVCFETDFDWDEDIEPDAGDTGPHGSCEVPCESDAECADSEICVEGANICGVP